MLTRSGVIYFYKDEPQKREDSLHGEMQDSRAAIQDTRFKTQEFESKIQNGRTITQDLGIKQRTSTVHKTDSASKIPVLSRPVIPPQQVRPPQRTIPQIPRPTALQRPYSAQKPVISAPPRPKAPERPAVPFTNGSVTPVIEFKPVTSDKVQTTNNKGTGTSEVASTISPHLMWSDSTLNVEKPHENTPSTMDPVQTQNLTSHVPIVVDHVPSAVQSTARRKVHLPWKRLAGAALLLAGVAGVVFPIIPQARLETSYATQQLERRVDMMVQPTVSMPPSVPLTFSPMIGPDGKEITPINTEFSIIVPKIGINAAVVASVDPLNPKEYTEALKKGVAHAKTSYFPNQDGAVYLFSHSTNYEWFVKDLNAIFYNLKNLEEGDLIILFYQGKRYTYQYKSREIVNPRDTTYLLPVTGKKQLILQTCWPPGTVSQRMLIFADLIEERGINI